MLLPESAGGKHYCVGRPQTWAEIDGLVRTLVRVRETVINANPQQVLPFAKFSLEAQALGDLNVEMTHRSICLPDFPAVSHVRRYFLRA